MIIPRSLFGNVFSTRQIEVLMKLANHIEDELSPVTLESVTDSTQLTSSAGVLTINWALGNMFHITLTENITSVVFVGLPSTGEGEAISLYITQHVDTPKTITGWPNEVSWFTADYEVSTTANVVDEVAFSFYKTIASGGVILGKYAKGADNDSGGGGG